MKRTIIFKFLFLIGITSLFFSSCASVPTKELNDAKKAIRESEKVNANKYASEELQEAKEHLQTANNQVKEDKNKEAKENAIKAKKAGDQAYFKALAEFVKSQNEGTKKSMEEAKASHADKLVPDKYNEAENLYQSAMTNMHKVNGLSEQLKADQTMQEKE